MADLNKLTNDQIEILDNMCFGAHEVQLGTLLNNLSQQQSSTGKSVEGVEMPIDHVYDEETEGLISSENTGVGAKGSEIFNDYEGGAYTGDLTPDDKEYPSEFSILGSPYPANAAIGLYSTSMGAANETIGDIAFAAGYKNVAFGRAATTFGRFNKAKARYSCAIGSGNSTYANCGFVFGLDNMVGSETTTPTNGDSYNGVEGAFAGGRSCKATSAQAIALGFQCEAKGKASVALGNTAIADNPNGAYAIGKTVNSIGNASFVTGIENTSSGRASFSCGEKNTASGNYSTSMGYGTEATGATSLAIGCQYEDSEHNIEKVKAIGKASLAGGMASTASGEGSVAFGYKSNSQGRYSFALGESTKTIGNSSLAIGLETTASGLASFSGGQKTAASGECSTSMGFSTNAIGKSSLATGVETSASGLASLSSGGKTVASGSYSVSIGYGTEASGAGSLAIGYQYNDEQKVKATGKASLAGGIASKASGEGSVAFGYKSDAQGKYSFAGGQQCGTLAEKSFAYGSGCKVDTDARFAAAIGDSVYAECESQLVHGRFNIRGNVNKNLAHVVGNGTDGTHRSNAYTLDWNGNGWFAGGVTIEGESTINSKLNCQDIATNTISSNEVESGTGAFRESVLIGLDQTGYIETSSIILRSSTEGSSKKFKLTIDDSGTISVSELEGV